MKQFLVLIFMLSWFGANCQRNYTSQVPKAVRLFDSAVEHYDMRHNAAALKQVEEALQADSTFVEAYLLRALIYEEENNTEKAIDAYEHSLRYFPDKFPNTYYTLGNLYLNAAYYGKAKVTFEKFLSYPKINPDMAYEARRNLKSSVFADSAMKHPVAFQPLNMGESINSPAEEYFPTITADGGIFIFTRRTQTVNAYGRPDMQEDFYECKKQGAGWSPSTPMVDINSSGNEGAAAISADGRYLFFTACKEPDGSYPGNRTGLGSCDIFLTRKDGSKWGQARNLEAPVNTGSWDAQPSFSSDGRTLYFVRKVKDKSGHTNSDILMTSINDSSRWSDPVSVSDRINTSGNEASVFIHPDNQTLYFSSDGHPGMGNLDLYLCRRQPDGSWGNPVNLGYPVNTSAEERSLMVAPTGGIAYFSSDRPEGKGGLDLYQFSLNPDVRPQPITYMKGRVMDAITRQPMSAAFELMDLATGKTVIRSTSDAVNGEFLLSLPAGKSYALNVSRKGYLFHSENFELKDPATAKEPFLKDVFLNPMKAGERMVLKNIFFATDSFRLKQESRAELDKLVSFMKANPGLKIEIGGHTDNVGEKKYNQALSEKRARSVFDYLREAGVTEVRMSFKGYGDIKPIASNNDESGRSQNRRTEFTVIEAGP